MDDSAEHKAWLTANELVEKHGDGATRAATERAAAFHYEHKQAEIDFWRMVARCTVTILRADGDLN